MKPLCKSQFIVKLAWQCCMQATIKCQARMALLQAQPGRAVGGSGPFKEAIVFMVGGGNYLEAESLATWASRAQPPKTVIYGATALLTGEQVAGQLAELGRRSGAT